LLRSKPASAIRLDKPERVSARHLTQEGEAREAQEFPLTREVGDAITCYVREVRPKCEHWEVFITHKGPLRPIAAQFYYGIREDGNAQDRARAPNHETIHEGDRLPG